MMLGKQRTDGIVREVFTRIQVLKDEENLREGKEARVVCCHVWLPNSICTCPLPLLHLTVSVPPRQGRIYRNYILPVSLITRVQSCG